MSGVNASCPELARNDMQTETALLSERVKACTKARCARLKPENVEIQEVSWQDSGQIAPRPAEIKLVSTKHTLLHPPLDEVLSTLKVE
jgi:hypothetical protein